jgi:hypothetical protein
MRFVGVICKKITAHQKKVPMSRFDVIIQLLYRPLSLAW